MNPVDVIGKESVVRLIGQTKLFKFIIFRGGATKGSTPIFRCTDTKTIEDAKRSFTDWADSILRMNPYNNMGYDLFLYSAKLDEDDIDKAMADDGEGRTKKDKVRFTFALNNYNNSNGNGGSAIGASEISSIIQAEFSKRDEADKISRLERELAELRDRKNSREDDDDDEGDEEEDEESSSALDKVFRVLHELNESERLKQKKNKVVVSGDDDDDDDDEEEEEDDDEDLDGINDDAGDDDDDDDDDEPVVKTKKLSPEQVEKMERMKKAITILWKHDKSLDRDLMKLAKLSEKQPKLFANVITSLRNMSI